MLRPPTGPLSARRSEFLSSPLHYLAPWGTTGRGPNGHLTVRVLRLPLRASDFPVVQTRGEASR